LLLGSFPRGAHCAIGGGLTAGLQQAVMIVIAGPLEPK
jgi:hypothetical protein